MAHFTEDRFDGVPDSLLRVGAHRSGVKRRGGLIVFAWAALACGVLVAAGIGYLTLANGSTQFSSPSSSSASAGTSTASPTTTPEPTATATPAAPGSVDSSVTTITVLNATSTSGLAASAGTALKNAGWVVGNEGNASSQVTTSVVYYDNTSASNGSIALGIANTLGIKAVEASTAFPGATITVVLGADYSAQ